MQELQKSRISRMGYYLVVPSPSVAVVAMGSFASVLQGWDDGRGHGRRAAAAATRNQINPARPTLIQPARPGRQAT